MTETHEMEAWAGPAWGELTDAQREQLARVADDVDERYPDPDDQPLRDAALSAVVQCMLGGITLAETGREFHQAQRAREIAKAAALGATLLASVDGRTETGIAEELGVTRMTVRSWLGKK